MINLGAWNVKGHNKANKQLEVARFLSNHNISLIGLLETKIKRAGLGALYLRVFSGWCITSNIAWHDGGRIIVGWRSEDIQIDIIQCDSQFIHLMGVPKTENSFHCTFVYGSSAIHERKKLFMSLQELSTCIKTPWIILGDFNCVANFDEHHGQPIRLHEIQPFRDCLDWCCLHDIQ